MSAISSWSKTAASNNSAPPDGWPEGQAPSTLNDCGREMMAQLRSTTMAVQQVNTETGAVATGTTIIPLDDTIPQNTEGDQYMSLSITPKSATNTLIIDVVIIMSTDTVGLMIAALFQDSTANALAVAASNSTVIGQTVTLNFRHKMVAGTTSATTFKVRAGLNVANNTVFNGTSGGARRFGGVYASSITITELLT